MIEEFVEFVVLFASISFKLIKLFIEEKS